MRGGHTDFLIYSPDFFLLCHAGIRAVLDLSLWAQAQIGARWDPLSPLSYVHY